MIRYPNRKAFVRNDAAAYRPTCKHLFEAGKQMLADEPAEGSPTRYRSTYETARLLAQVVSALGWVVAVVGVLASLSVIAEINRRGGGPDDVFFGTLPMAAVVLAGLVTAATGQIYRAVVDTADHTGEMLHLMRNGRGESVPGEPAGNG